MEPLIVLLTSALAVLLLTKAWKKEWLPIFSARAGMSAMLIFTGISHFIFPEGMTLMLPGFIPYPQAAIYVTGLIEIAAAIGLQIPSLQKLTGWLLILFFLLILPANIHAALNNVNIQTGRYDGPGPAYLWFRIPLQLFYIVWVYVTAAGFPSQIRKRAFAS